jgi:PAS domain S-box-containing protein
MPRSTSVMRTIVWLTPAVLIATLAGTFIIGGLALRATARLDAHRQTIEAVVQFESDLKDAETGERGYLLTGDSKYLGPYNSGFAEVTRDLQNLSGLAEAGELPASDFQAIQKLAGAKLAELRATVVRRKEQGLAAALPMVTTDYGRKLMDAVRGRVQTLVANLDQQSTQIEAESETIEQYRTGTFLLAILINLAVLFWSYRLIQHETRRREAIALELERQKQLLEVTLGSIGDGVIVADLDGRVAFLNQTAEQLTGWKSADAAGQACTAVFNIIDEASRAAVESPVAKVLKLGRAAALENHTLLIRKDEGELPIDDSGAPIREANGVVRGVVLIFRDATTQREAFRRIEQANRVLHEANETKDQFLATLSHELRTPLTPVLALLSSWEQDRTIPEAFQEDVKLLRRNVELEARLIDDLLDLTRIAKGKLSLRPQKLDLFHVLNSVIEMYRPALEQAGLNVVLNFQALSHHVEADIARLHQIFGNIVGNAVKFTPRAGQISISVIDSPDNQIIVTVEDNGVGMTPETLRRVFQPFEQGQTGADNRGGLGLGMSVAKRLVELHGGTISAKSAGPDRGSTFTVTLPTVDPGRESFPVVPPKNGVPPPVPQRARILVVEDHEDTAEVMARLLINHGYQVAVSSSIADALRKMNSDEYDLLLSDIGLPDGSGVDLIRNIRRHSAIPAIALTGFGSDNQVAEYCAAGFNTHLAKPVNFEQLETVVQQLLARVNNSSIST